MPTQATKKSGGKPPAGSKTSRLSFAQGPAFIKIINDDYRTVFAAILEYIQNPIDANATRIEVFVNKRTHNITIKDNGDGVSLQDLEQVMLNVMQSVKKRDKKYGKFGEGLYSAIGKCEWFKFISCPKDGLVYTEFTFNTDDIRAQHERIEIPNRERHDLQYRGVSRRGITPVDYRTCVEIHSFTNDRHIGAVPKAEAIFEAACERYREIMLENKVFLSILIADENGRHDKHEGCAEPYSGEALTEAKYGDTGSGRTTFHMLLSRKDPVKGFRGKVSIGESGGASRVPFRSFAKAAAGLLSGDTVTALNSGVFEGDILSDKAKIHPDRLSFVQDEALTELCIAIEQWFDEVGRAHYESVIDEKEAESLQKLGDELKRNIEVIFQDPRLAEFLQKITDGIKLKVKTPDPKGDDEIEVPSSGKGGGGGGGGGGGTSKREKKKKRARVTSETLGITISYDGEYLTKDLYIYDGDVATLYFNRRHPTWAACERGGKIGREIRQLQEFVTIQVLAEQLIPDYAREGSAELMKPLVEFFVLLIKSSPSYLHLSGLRGKGKQPKS